MMLAELELALPYSLGLVAAFNPCGFALLPTYLAYFLGLETPSTAVEGADGGRVADGGVAVLAVVVRGIVVGLTLTAGFVSVFGVFGILFATILSQGVVLENAGYVTVVVGIGMIGLSVAMLSGRGVNLNFLKFSSGGCGRGLVSIFMFGVSYAVVSLSCTVGLFVVGVSTVFFDDGFFDGAANFAAYGVGMGSVITFLTLSLALAGSRVVRAVSGARRWVDPISALALAAAGAYLVNYGWWELRVFADPTAENMLVSWFTEFQADVSGWIASTGTQRLGVVCVFGVVGALMLGWGQQQADRKLRLAVGSVYAAVWLVVEFGFNGGDFVWEPVWRFVLGWPGRVVGWFENPFRFGVIAEIVVAALSLWMAARLAKRLYRRVRLRYLRHPLEESQTIPTSDPELERSQSDHVDAHC